MLVLVGGQGLGKSTMVKKLGVDWGSDSLDSFKGKEAYEQLQGAWIIELAELSAMGKSDINTIKHFLTKTEDRFRAAYARRVTGVARQCILIGTSNTDDFLKDPTGDRRVYPLDVGRIKNTKNVIKDLSRKEMGQIWAEAYTLYKKGFMMISF